MSQYSTSEAKRHLVGHHLDVLVATTRKNCDTGAIGWKASGCLVVILDDGLLEPVILLLSDNAVVVGLFQILQLLADGG